MYWRRTKQKRDRTEYDRASEQAYDVLAGHGGQGAGQTADAAAETLEPAPTRVDPGSPWPFFILGALGMVALGAAGAAFRRAAHPGGGDTGLIGAALGVIAVACIAVAGWNLYQRWGRPGR